MTTRVFPARGVHTTINTQNVRMADLDHSFFAAIMYVHYTYIAGSCQPCLKKRARDEAELPEEFSLKAVTVKLTLAMCTGRRSGLGSRR